MPGIMDLLGRLGRLGNSNAEVSPDTPQMTPEMIALMTEIGRGKYAPSAKDKILQQTGSNPYHAVHWSQGVADMLNAISGNDMINRADQSRVGSRLRVPTVAGPTQANSPPNSGRIPPQAAPNNPAQTMFGVIPGPLPQNFSEAPREQGANANIAPMRLGGPRSSTGQGATPNLTEITGPSGARFRVNSDHADRFQGFIDDLHAEGYNVYGEQSGGYNNRNIRGTNIRSPHADGNAIDINWMDNAEGTQGNIPPDVARRLANKHGLRWGRDFRNRRSDPMHFEIDPEYRPATASNLENRSIVAQAGLRPIQVADRQSAPQNNPPPPRDEFNRPKGPSGLPLFNPESDFRPTFPTPPPDDFGLTPQQSMDLDNLSERAYKRKIESLSRQWEPQYTDVQGGRRWIVPATGQTGFIPIPKYEHIEARGTKIPIVTITDQYGRTKTYDLSPNAQTPDANTSVSTPPPNQSQIPPQAPVVPPNAAVAPPPETVQSPPVAPPAQPQQPPQPSLSPAQELIGPAGGLNPPTQDERLNSIFSNPNFTIRPAPHSGYPTHSFGTDVPGINLDSGIDLQSRPQAGIEPELPIVSPLPNSPQNAPNVQTGNAPPVPKGGTILRHPIFEDARRIEREEEIKKETGVALAKGRVDPIVEAMQRGNEAVQLRNLVRQLEELENLPGMQDIFTGPLAEKFLSGHQTLNAFLHAAGITEMRPDIVAAAETLQKLNTMIGSVGARQLTNRPTQFDFQAFLKANPGLIASPSGRRFLTQILGQMADRDVALGDAATRMGIDTERWPQVRDQVLDQHRMIIDGTVLNNTMNNAMFDVQSGRIIPREYVRGQIIQGYQYTGRTGNREDAENPRLWVQVDPYDARTHRVQPPASISGTRK